MIVPLPTDILRTPIPRIPELSRAFRRRCLACGFPTLHDLCGRGADAVSQPSLLGPALFRELVDFLAARRLLHVLAPSG